MQIQSFYILYSSFSIVFFIRAHGDANGTLDFYIAHYPNPGIISISSVPVLPSKIVKLKATPKTSVLHPKFSHGLIPQLQRSLYVFVTPRLMPIFLPTPVKAFATLQLMLYKYNITSESPLNIPLESPLNLVTKQTVE